MTADRLLFHSPDWDFQTIQRIHDAVAEIALGELKLDIYPNQIEIITSEQMLDAYASTGMPLFYKHWSFGKHFTASEANYRRGLMGLAYEIVINSNPCISYLMEENTTTMQTLVIAHAAFGHNHFFKNNYLFKQWTDAEGILPYLEFAKKFISQCEERYGPQRVEKLLDAAHALMAHGIHRSPRRKQPDLLSEQRREQERIAHQEAIYNDLWRTTVYNDDKQPVKDVGLSQRMALLELPQENILYFLEKTAPRLQPWQREILRIIRQIAQYFYPQRQTKVMNEGCATYCHYRILTRLHEKGQISDGSFLEVLQSHTNVIAQPGFEHPAFNGFNPYALGFAMMQDIERICKEPTEEDKAWFPEIAGTGDEMAVLKDIWANYRDESFIAQYLSPHLIRKFKLFQITEDSDEPEISVDAIHNERGYRMIRRTLSRQYDIGWQDPDIKVVDVDLAGDRRLILHHSTLQGAYLEENGTQAVLQHLADIWGYDVQLKEVSSVSGVTLGEFTAHPRPTFL
ncbi:SpoVR family protein [Microvirga sp. W0021]|uniref:SpoVR family protein n=1 Tax=Hohaiivirga grylli TaxID=3133970 RepID=A0ABV0BJC6_9HYPH